MSQLASKVTIVEVGPRDGLQNETNFLNTVNKIAFINRLSETGLKVIETTSFVSAKRIPQLADSEAVYTGIQKKNGVHYPVLIPNREGLLRAIAVGVREIAVFTTPSESFSMKNTHCTVAESLARIEEVMLLAKEHAISVRAYISCVLGCPYEGEIAADKVTKLAARLYQMGCREISLGDTIGVGTPLKTEKLIASVTEKVPVNQLAVHFHDTYGQALVNIYAAYRLGISIVDSSVAGLGGCPYAPGASGNVATEDVVYMFDGMGVATGVDLKKLASVGQDICRQLGRQSNSRVQIALQA